MLTKHWWFSGRILACHAGGPGSIPGQCNVTFCAYLQQKEENMFSKLRILKMCVYITILMLRINSYVVCYVCLRFLSLINH